MKRVRWGIVGTGRMAETIAAELAALRPEGAALQAVASRDPVRGRAFAARHSIPTAWASCAELAADPLVDVVYIASPHILHREHSLSCIHAGKAVLCEKPFTIAAPETEEVVAAARARGVFVMEAMWTRFLPAITALRAQLAAGAVGRVRLIVGGGAFIPDLPAGHYLFDRGLGGGVLLDAGVYLVSMASMILGTPTRIEAIGALGRGDVDEQDSMLLEFPGGATALLYVSLRARRPPDLEILGDTGRIRIAPPVFRPTRLIHVAANGTETVADHPVDGSGYGYQLRAVHAALRAGRSESAVMPLEETLSIMTTLDAIRRKTGLRYPHELP